jgi:tetratricopeptide (TPR) repeat protein
VVFLFLLAIWAGAQTLPPGLDAARNAQDRGALERLAAERSEAAAKRPDDATAQYQAAVAQSYLAEVALELKDKNRARIAAEAGIRAAERAVAVEGRSAENHRILGTLCGQVIPANVLAGLRYGRCALDEITKALELDPRSALAWVSRGVGNYYLPPAFGGGVENSIRDFKKAIEVNPKLAEAHMWLGIALREANRNGEARAALKRAVDLNPQRLWAKQQYEKTPAK